MSTEPKNILFTTWEGGGNVPPVITLARKLRARGHRVRLMSDEASREDAAAAGIAFHAWQTAPNRADKTPASCPLRDWEAASPQEGIGLALDKILFGPSLDYARDLAAELDREPADLVVTSDMLPGILAGCESRAQPVAIPLRQSVPVSTGRNADLWPRTAATAHCRRRSHARPDSPGHARDAGCPPGGAE
jgi:UDP:flavonoid glycosyltransferase YjiC (YdhE family)